MLAEAPALVTHPGYFASETIAQHPYWERDGITRETTVTPEVIRRLSFITPAIRVLKVLSDSDGYVWVVRGTDQTGLDGWGVSMLQISGSIAKRREASFNLFSDTVPGGLVGMQATVGEIEDVLHATNARWAQQTQEYHWPTRVSVLGPSISVDRTTGVVQTNVNDLAKWELPIKVLERLR